MSPETLHDVALAVAAERSVDRILAQIVNGLAAQPTVALARVWLIGPGDICGSCSMRAECPDQTRCLHLSASTGNPVDGSENWSRLNGAFRRFPLGVRKMGRIGATGEGLLVEDIELDHSWIARPDWVRKEGIRSFAGQPLVFRNEVLGVLGLFSREPCDRRTFAWLRAFADHAAIAISHARALEEVEQLKGQLAEAQRLSSTGSFTWHEANDNVIWSDENYRIFQVDRSTPVTFELIRSRLHPEDLPLFKEQIEGAREDGRDLEFDFRLLPPDRSVRYIHVVARSRRDGKGDLQYTGAVRDVTEQRLSDEALGKVRSELAHVSRVTALGELTASLAHEVNQPLTAVINNANACLDLLPISAPHLREVRTALGEIVDDADRASAVIARVRQLVKKAPFASGLLNLLEVIADVLAIARYELTAHQVTIRTDLSADTPAVMGDRVQLQQVLLNLVFNAMEAMKATEETHRIVTIAARREFRDGTPVALLSVRDAGVGFQNTDMDLLFDAFYTTKPQGMGMGLAIGRSIVEAHGGRLWSEPNSGVGAAFLFHLPAAMEAAS